MYCYGIVKRWTILKHWKSVIRLIDLIKDAYKDRKITGQEAELVVAQAIETLVEMKIIDRE